MEDEPSPSIIVWRTIGFAVCGIPFGAFGGWILASALGPEMPLLLTIIAAASVIASVFGVVGLVLGLRDYSKTTAAYIRTKEVNEQQAASQRKSEQSTALNNASYCSDLALRSYRSAVQHLSAASAAAISAEQHRSKRAFTPFWSAIEEGYERLGQHVQDLETIKGCAERYPSLLNRVAGIAAGRLAEVPPFPLEASKIADIDPGLPIAYKLQALTYSAQQDFEYASIFEQRRTTSAVIAGFRNLSSAVAGMSAAMHESTRSMVASVDNVRVETKRVNDSLNVTGYGAVTGSVAAEVRQLNENLTRLSRQ